MAQAMERLRVVELVLVAATSTDQHWTQKVVHHATKTLKVNCCSMREIKGENKNQSNVELRGGRKRLTGASIWAF